MAHKKAGGSKARQGANVAGKRLGIKAFGGAVVKPGQIILRQRGRVFISGENTSMGKDFTIWAKTAGTVVYNWVKKTKKAVLVKPFK